ncbi:MAG TPA: quinol:electron acceptor oxidoreductase subunit ActD [Vicinamibacterales bacterium]|nr:quinol:electron acceptor oxidoreductase subunit ActD [Vicinamibacterales bacterium]
MKAIYALCPDGASAQQAVNRLRAAGVPDPDITILLPEPMEEYEFARRDRQTWMWWMACAGGLAGMAAAAGLAWITEMSWPIDVGGLPIWAWWPNLIIFFELTMLGAILATVTTLIASAGLGRGGLYDPAVSDGKILVGVEHPAPSRAADIEQALAAVGGAELKRI